MGTSPLVSLLLYCWLSSCSSVRQRTHSVDPVGGVTPRMAPQLFRACSPWSCLSQGNGTCSITCPLCPPRLPTASACCCLRSLRLPAAPWWCPSQRCPPCSPSAS